VPDPMSISILIHEEEHRKNSGEGRALNTSLSPAKSRILKSYPRINSSYLKKQNIIIKLQKACCPYVILGNVRKGSKKEVPRKDFEGCMKKTN